MNFERNVVFLDIDGVVQPFNTEWFSESAMALIRELCATCNAVVVLSSAWRITKESLSVAQSRLKAAGIDVRACDDRRARAHAHVSLMKVVSETDFRRHEPVDARLGARQVARDQGVAGNGADEARVRR